MARIKGDKPYGLQFESTVPADLDARKEIPLLADLTAANTWTALNGAPNHYEGMTTFCLENKKEYRLLNEDVTNINSWLCLSDLLRNDTFLTVNATGDFSFTYVVDNVAEARMLRWQNGTIFINWVVNGTTIRKRLNDPTLDSSGVFTATGGVVWVTAEDMLSAESVATILYGNKVPQDAIIIGYLPYENNIKEVKGLLNELITVYNNSSSGNTTYDFKASDYVTDKTNATAGLQALFDAVAASDLKMPNVLFEAGDYYCDNNLTLRHGCNIQGLAAALLFNDCPDSITGYHLHILPNESTVKYNLATAITAGSKTLSVTSVENLNVGDVLTIQNSVDGSFIKFANGKSYRQGEMIEVENIDTLTNTITLKSALLASYTIDACNLIKQPKITVNITGLEIVSKDLGTSNSPTGLRVTYGYMCTFENLLMSGSCNAQMTLRNCIKCLVNNIKIDYKSTANVNLNYGVQINSCYHIEIANSFIKTTRHALTVGSFDGDNTIINRYISYANNTLGTYELIAADFHSNCEYVTMRDNTITGSVSLRGTKMMIRDNYISNADVASDPPISISNLNSSDINIINNYIITNRFTPSSTYVGVIYIDSYVPLEFNEQPLVVRGNKIINADANTTSTSLMFFRINAIDEEYLNILSNLVVCDNTLIGVSDTILHSIDIRNGVTNVDFNNNTTNKCSIAQATAEHLTLFANKSNRYLKGGRYAVESRATKATVIIEGNRVESTESCAFYATGTPNVFLMQNTIDNSCAGQLEGTINRTAFCFINNAKHIVIDKNSLINGEDANVDYLFHLNNTALVEVGSNTSNLSKIDSLTNLTTIKGVNQKLLTEVISGDSASNYQGAMVWDDSNKRYVYRVGNEYLPASSELAVYTTSSLPATTGAGNSIYWNILNPTALFSDGERWVNAFGQTAARGVGYSGQRPTNLRTEAVDGANFYKDLGFQYYDRDSNKVLRWNGAAFMDANNQTPVARMYGSDSVQTALETTLTTIDRGRIFYKETWNQFLIWEGTRFVSAIDGKTPRRFFEGQTARRPTISGGSENTDLVASDVGMRFHDTTVDKILILQTNAAGELEWLDQNGRTPYRDSGYSRPTNLISYSAGSGGDSRDLGAQFFDFTLGQPIWWTLDGKWVNANGGEV